MSDERFAPISLRTEDGDRASLCRHGAQLLHWCPGGSEERLYLSTAAIFTPSRAIRGGIPVLFPQFGLFGDLPKHGLVRDADWMQQATDSPRHARLTLEDTPESHRHWPHAFRAALEVELESQTLTTSLAIDNTGNEAFSFTVGLHTYLAVADLATLSIKGLQGLQYLDATQALMSCTETAEAVQIRGEIDRVYLNASTPVEVVDAHRRTLVSQQGFCDVVVWNPGPDKVRELSDMPPDDYLRMVCVEAAVIGEPVTLAPGAQWRGRQTLRALPDGPA